MPPEDQPERPEQPARPDGSMPPDPVSALAAGAAQLHELFMAWVSSGFTRAEALQLVIAVMMRGPGGGDG